MTLAERLTSLMESALDKADSAPAYRSTRETLVDVFQGEGGALRKWKSQLRASQDGERCTVSFSARHPYKSQIPVLESPAAGILLMGGASLDSRRAEFVRGCVDGMSAAVLDEVRSAAGLMRACGLTEEEMRALLDETVAADVHGS